MLLRESSRILGQEVDIEAVLDSERVSAGRGYGFPAADELLAFATAANRVANPAMASANPAMASGGRLASTDLASAREKLQAVVGPEGLLEAAATVAAFNGLVRVADGTGIELDDAMVVASSDVRTHLGLNEMAGSANTSRLDTKSDGVVFGAAGDDGRVRSLFADAD